MFRRNGPAFSRSLLTLAVLVLVSSAALAGTPAYEAAVLDDSPVVFYRLGETSGTVADDASSNMFDGSYVGSPTLGVPGLGTGSDSAVTLDGASQYISASTSVNPFGMSLGTSSFEFAFSTETAAQAALAGTFNTGSTTAFELNLNRNPAGSSVGDYVRLYLRDDAGNDMGAAFQNLNAFDGNLHHLLFTYDSTGATDADRVKAYLDGTLQAIEFSPNNEPALDGGFSNFGFTPAFGARNVRGTYGQFFAGTLDEVALYDTVLTEADAIARAEALGIEIAMPNQWSIDGGGSFNVAGNWTDNVVPTSDALFGTALTGANAPATITLDSAVSLNRVSFQNGNQYIIDGPNALTLTGVREVSVGGTHQIAADIAGTAGLVKTNSGTLILAEAKSYTGTTDVQEGVLLLNNLDAIDNQASGTLNVGPNGTGLLGAGATGTLAAQLTGTGIVNLDDALEPTDTVTISRSNAGFEGLIRIDDGTLVVTNSNALGTGGGTDNRTTLDDNSTAKVALQGNVAIAAELLDMDGRDTDAVGLTSAGTNAWNGNIDGQGSGVLSRFNIESTSGTLTLGRLYGADIDAPQNFVFSGDGDIVVDGAIAETELDNVTGGDTGTSSFDNVGVIKRGSGNLTIAIGSGTGGGRLDFWFGPTVIEEGTLTVTDPDAPDQGELRSSDITVMSNATLNISAFTAYAQQENQTFRGSGTIVANTLELYDDTSLAPGDAVGQSGTLEVQGNVTLSDQFGGGGTWAFDVGNNADTTGDVLNVSSGTFSTVGTPAVIANITPANGHLDAGRKTIVAHNGGSTSGMNSIVAQITDAAGNPLNTRQTVAINGDMAGQVDVVVSGEEQLRTWSGTSSTAWDVDTTSNWQQGDQRFKQLDRVTFDDSATGTTDVEVDGDRYAGEVNFSNNSKVYTLTGTGGIVGTGGVNVTGSAEVRLANTGNSYSGDTTIAPGSSLQVTTATSGSINNSGVLSLRTATDVMALVQNGVQTIGAGNYKVIAVEAENYQAETVNDAGTVMWNETASIAGSLGGQALIAGPDSSNNLATDTASQNYVTYSLKFTEPGAYYWFGRLKAEDGGADDAPTTPDGLSNNDDSLWLPATDLGNGVADPLTLSTRIDLASATTTVNAEGVAASTEFFDYDWYRSAAGDNGFDRIVVTADDVANGSVFQFKVATRESGGVVDKHVFVQDPDFGSDPTFGTITDTDLDGVSVVTTTSAESFFSAGTVLNVDGDLTMSGDSSGLSLLVGTPDLHDQVLIAGNLVADGVLTIGSGNGGIVAGAGDVFDIFSFTAASGAFDDIVLPGLGAGLGWDTTNLLVTGELAVIAAGLPGDFNNDGMVNLADYTFWRNNLGADESVLPAGSGDGSLVVDAGDYDLWKSNFGASIAASGAVASASVPEPSSWVLLSMLAIALGLYRRAN